MRHERGTHVTALQARCLWSLSHSQTLSGRGRSRHDHGTALAAATASLTSTRNWVGYFRGLSQRIIQLAFVVYSRISFPLASDCPSLSSLSLLWVAGSGRKGTLSSDRRTGCFFVGGKFKVSLCLIIDFFFCPPVFALGGDVFV